MEHHYLVESVHVQLSDEGCHVGVLVVVGQQCLGKLGLELEQNCAVRQYSLGLGAEMEIKFYCASIL